MKKFYALALCSMLALQASAQMTHTTVAQGEVEGVAEQGMGYFKGIPFAQPPVGDLRWKAPVPASSWEGVYQAKEFKEACDITGIILTKMDGTAKGGIAIAIWNELKIPVKYIGVGEGIEDLQKFDSKSFVKAIFDN